MNPRGYLIDTHVLLWWLTDEGSLSDAARAAIADPTRPVQVSAAAIWEMSIKRSIGKLDYPDDLADALQRSRIDVLPIGFAHASAVADLPLIHQDPFDRMQVAQARMEKLAIITRDRQIVKYGVPVVEA